MGIVRHTAGKELTTEKEKIMREEVRAAARRAYTYDPDSPLLTEKQLNEFRPVNFKSLEEREEAMRQELPSLAVSGE